MSKSGGKKTADSPAFAGNVSALLTHARIKAGSKPVVRASVLITPLYAAQGDADVLNQEPGAYKS